MDVLLSKNGQNLLPLTFDFLDNIFGTIEIIASLSRLIMVIVATLAFASWSDFHFFLSESNLLKKRPSVSR